MIVWGALRKMWQAGQRTFSSPSTLLLVTPHLKYFVESWGPQLKRDKQLPEEVQHRARKRLRELEYVCDKERLRDLAMLSLEKRRLRMSLIFINIWRGSVNEKRPVSSSDRTEGNGHKWTQEDPSEHKERLLCFGVTEHWNTLPREAKFPFLKITRTYLDVFLFNLL